MAASLTDWTTTTPLLPHQRAAVAKLLPARVGALFAEMGTGKSRIAIELARLRQAKIDRVIWCCPVSAKETIRREILKHTGAEQAVHVFDERTTERRIPPAWWYVVGTESLSASARVLFALRDLICERCLVIVDESHQIKGHRSKRTERLTLLASQARYRLILTGTPISQGVVDLFAQMRFLSHRILGYRSFHTFARHHLVYSDKFPGRIEREINRDYLAAQIKPYVYQITKDECLTLPAKLYTGRCCGMQFTQQNAYAEAKERILTIDYLMGEEWERRIAIFHLFTVLQTIACGFETLADGTVRRYPHDRLGLLRETLEEIPRAAPVVIWAKYHACLEEIAVCLGAHAIVYHGKLSERQRQANLDAWRAGEARYLIATQAAGGQALDLTRANYVVYYANGFKFSERQQSEDRCHRIGQSRPVTYIDLWARCGIDKRIEDALARKENVVNRFREEVNKVRATSKEKLKELVGAL